MTNRFRMSQQMLSKYILKRLRSHLVISSVVVVTSIRTVIENTIEINTTGVSSPVYEVIIFFLIIVLVITLIRITVINKKIRLKAKTSNMKVLYSGEIQYWYYYTSGDGYYYDIYIYTINNISKLKTTSTEYKLRGNILLERITKNDDTVTAVKELKIPNYFSNLRWLENVVVPEKSKQKISQKNKDVAVEYNPSESLVICNIPTSLVQA